MQTATYSNIRAWNNTSAERKCHQCGMPLGEKYIRVGSMYFCPMIPDGTGLSAICFSTWAVNRFPGSIARRMIVELPTPEMKG